MASRLTELLHRIDGESEIILVNDGSTDASEKLINELAKKDPRIVGIHLSRNFGHQIAITAGMEQSRGDAIIIMDADLQDPPEVALDLIEKWKQGYDVVNARRRIRKGESALKKITASLFYRILSRMTDLDIPVDVGDFRLVDRKALSAFLQLKENNRFVRGMFSWIGFRQTYVLFDRDSRHAGKTKYPFGKMLKLAVNGILSFSDAPLRYVLNIGFLVSGISFLAAITVVVIKILGVFSVPGWTSLVLINACLGGIQLVVVGVLGQYIARIHEEVKGRPLYLVRAITTKDARQK